MNDKCAYEKCHGYIEPDDMPVTVKVNGYNVLMHEWCAEYHKKEAQQAQQGGGPTSTPSRSVPA